MVGTDLDAEVACLLDVAVVAWIFRVQSLRGFDEDELQTMVQRYFFPAQFAPMDRDVDAIVASGVVTARGVVVGPVGVVGAGIEHLPGLQ